MKKIIKLIVCISLFLIAGCSSKKELDPQSILTDANQKMNQIDSMSTHTLMKMSVSFGGDSSMDMNMRMNMKMANISSDLRYMMEMTTEYNGETMSIISTYIDGVMYMESDGQKMKLETDIDEVGSEIEVGQIDTTFKDMKAVESGGKYVITVHLSEDEVSKLMDQLGSILNSTGLDENSFEMFESLEFEDFVIKVNKDGYVESETFGFTGEMDGMKMSIHADMTFDGYNSTVVDDIENKDDYISYTE